MRWIYLAIISLVLFGTSRTLYIIGSRYGSESAFLIILNAVATLLSLLIIFILGRTSINIGDLLCGTSLGTLSAVGAVSLYRANATSSPSLVNIILGLNFIIPLIVGLLIFKERLDFYQCVGLYIVILTILLSMYEALRGPENYLNVIGIAYALVTFFSWGFLGVMVKVFRIMGLLTNFPFCIFLMYLFELTLLVCYYRRRESVNRDVLAASVLAGACSCVGSYLALICYAVGEISITSLILRFAFIIPTLYSMIRLRDFDKLKIVLLCLSTASVVLISL
ncbi:MAG: EamA family transporter [Crenarchaeota archaeon]|nr:EamA family transporter [Thermoproteota archaeon]